MENKFRLASLTFALAAAITFSNTEIYANPAPKDVKTSTVTEKETCKPVDLSEYTVVDPIQLVTNPQNYLNKKIKINAQFNKFSTLGLDYPPANRSSKDYISFLIKRPVENCTDCTIPLSELKLIVKRDKAEKIIDIESGDKIELYGTVFSAALNDPWVDVLEVKVLNAKPKTDKKPAK